MYFEMEVYIIKQKNVAIRFSFLTLKQFILLIRFFCSLLSMLMDNFSLKEFIPKPTLLLYSANVFTILINYAHQSPVHSSIPFLLIALYYQNFLIDLFPSQ